jgi:hypothetical protein
MLNSAKNDGACRMYIIGVSKWGWGGGGLSYFRTAEN